MKIYALTIAYCPAVLLARSLILYRKTRAHKPQRHIVVQGHYPINQRKNDNDIKLIVDCFPEIELWDPGKNLGSAQSQNWALQRMGLDADDAFINLDPDSACLKPGWDSAMQGVLEGDPNCVLISCMAPLVERNSRAPMEEKSLYTGLRYAVPKTPTPFNLSLWRYSFVKDIGGIPQMGLWWGETEAGFFAACQRTGKYHAYLMDYVENEDGKFMQDVHQNQWKDLHCRVHNDQKFLGSYDEYLAYKYPELLQIDTAKDFSDHCHR